MNRARGIVMTSTQPALQPYNHQSHLQSYPHCQKQEHTRAFTAQLANTAAYSLMKIAFLETLGIFRWVLLIVDGFIQVQMQQRYLFVILRIWG